MPTVFIDRILLNGGSDPVVVDNTLTMGRRYVRDQYGNLNIHTPDTILKVNSSTALVSTVNLVVKR